MHTSTPDQQTNPRIAIVYDRVNSFGGAERVLCSLLATFADATLYTAVYNQTTASWAKPYRVVPSFLQRIPFARRHHQWFGWLMPAAFESLRIDDADVVITVTSEAAKNICSTSAQIHICYCLTPTRYLWSHTHFYASGALSWLRRVVFSSLRYQDFIAARRPDLLVAISTTVSARIQKYYRRDCTIIVPPLTLCPHTQKEGGRTYCLIVSRLVSYKRLDLAILACRALGLPLKIVGVGAEQSRLRTLAAGADCEFVGFVEDDRLASLYAGALALICPQEEDFGIVSLEAQAHGTPVVAYSVGGLAETVVDGLTGVLFARQEQKAVEEALVRVRAIKWDRQRIRDHARRFDEETFQKQWKSLVFGRWHAHNKIGSVE